MQVNIFAHDQVLFEGTADMVVIPGVEGDLGVLDLHAPLMTQLRAGEINLFKNHKVFQTYPVKAGFAQVTALGCQIFLTP